MMNTKMKLKSVGCSIHPSSFSNSAMELLFPFFNSSYVVFPGFCDVHVHLREPGFSYKETIKTGTAACARGGYTSVCAMANLKPVPDSLENLKVQRQLIEDTASIHVYPYGAITVGEQGEVLADLEEMAPYVAGFSDDGRGVQSREMMKQAMEKAKSLGKVIVAHCEVNELLKGGYIHDGAYCAAHGHKGICSASEYEQIARDLELVAETGCAYHVCHISTKESVDLIRKAKKQGLDVTCETAPHYLVMDDSFLQEDGRLDRSLLSSIVFRGPRCREALAALESVVHPAVLRDFETWKTSGAVVGAALSGTVVMESAIILDKPLFRQVADRVLLVDAPEEIRLRRAAARDGVPVEHIASRICLQQRIFADTGHGKMRPDIDFTIENTGTPEELGRKVDEFIDLNYVKVK